MPHPFPLASVFTAGMRRDMDRTELPGGSAYNLLDFIPDEIQAVTGGRGGWTYTGATLSGATSIYQVAYHPDTGKLIAIDQARNLWDVNAGSTIGNLPASLAHVPGTLTYHRGYIIIPDGSGTAGPAYYKSDGTVGSLTAPSMEFSAVYKDHAILYRTGSNNNRIYFSAAGDPTTWDTTFGWWDTTGNMTGLATLPNCILVFHNASTERLRGTTPPPGSDFVLDMFMPNVGCIDPNSISYWEGQAIWAASQGIFMSDGAKVVDLTTNAQMTTYWASLMAGYSTSWRISGGVYRGHYIVSINNGSTLIDCLCVNLASQTMWRFTNIHGGGFFNQTFGSQEKLYMGQWNGGRVVELSSIWNPSASVKHDADGTTPTPIVETAMYRGYDRLHRRWIESMGKQKWRFAYVDYDLRDSASDNPTMTLSYCNTPTGSYTSVDRTLSATTDYARIRRSLSPTQGGATHSQMLGLKLAVTGPYAKANLYTIEGSFEPIEIGAL